MSALPEGSEVDDVSDVSRARYVSIRQLALLPC